MQSSGCLCDYHLLSPVAVKLIITCTFSGGGGGGRRYLFISLETSLV